MIIFVSISYALIICMITVYGKMPSLPFTIVIFRYKYFYSYYKPAKKIIKYCFYSNETMKITDRWRSNPRINRIFRTYIKFMHKVFEQWNFNYIFSSFPQHPQVPHMLYRIKTHVRYHLVSPKQASRRAPDYHMSIRPLQLLA